MRVQKLLLHLGIFNILYNVYILFLCITLFDYVLFLFEINSTLNTI